MAATLPEILNAGHAKIELIWHPGGIPWAASSSSKFLANITSAHRKLMFGYQQWAGPTYYADKVDIYPLLQPPKGWTISLKDGEGELDGGDWTAEIADIHVVPALWDLNPRTIYGLEGLQAVATPRNDDTLGHAILYDGLGKAATHIHVWEDWGATLEDEIAAGGGTRHVLWIGNMAIGVDGTTADAVGVKLDIDTGHTGLLRSAPQSFFPTHNGADIPVTDAPLYGLAGRPWYLWGYACETDGTIIDGPALLHHGKIGTQAKQNDAGRSVWQVQCLPWWKHLDTDIVIEDVAASLDRYVFSRGPSGSSHPPHMQIDEYTGGVWNGAVDIWLCAANSTVMYRDLDELYAAVLTAVNAASPNGWNWTIGAAGPHYLNGADKARIRGDLVGLFTWGDIKFGGEAFQVYEETQQALAEYRVYGDSWTHPWWTKDDGWLITESSDYITGRPAPDYCYQWYWHTDTDYDDDNPNEGEFKLFPVPVDPTTGNPTLWIKEDSANVADIDTADELQIGDEESHMMFGSYGDTTIATISKTGISAVGGGPDAGDDENYIELNSDPDWPSTPLECLVGQLEQNPDYSWYYKKFCKGMYLFYKPSVHAKDPWPVRQNFDVTVSKLSTIFLALCGDTSEITIPEIIQADFVPDMRELADHNMHETVDWDTIDALVGEQAADVAGVYFQFRFAGTVNLWSMLKHELRFWGLTPFWYYDDVKDMYRLSARKVGTVNATAAFASGRSLDASTIAKGTFPKVEKGAEPVYNSIALKLNYNHLSNKYEYETSVQGNLAATGGRAVEVKCAPKITHVDLSNPSALGDLNLHFSKIVGGTQITRETQSVEAAVTDVIAQGVGLESLVSHDAPHDADDGDVGFTDKPAVITSMSTNYADATVGYRYRLAEGRNYGWVPACKITACHTDGTTELHVTDVGGSGQLLTNISPFFGWMDYWFFDDFRFNQTMSTPIDDACCSDYAVKLIELGTDNPTIYTGLRVKSVTTDTYADAPAQFFIVYGVGGWQAAFDTGTDHIMVFDDYDATHITDCQKRWVFQADTTGKIEAGVPGERWQI
jgi:hypothetical protein